MSSSSPDRVCLITGGSSGIGAGVARLLVERGERVALAARSARQLDRLAAELEAPERILTVACDVLDWDQQQALVARALERFGRVDVVIASAGCEIGSDLVGGADTPEEWRQMVLTNVYGVALTARAATPALVESGGQLVLMGSVAGRVALPGSLYSATKWALSGMAESLRQELVEPGVRVTVVQPGRVDTPLQPEELEAPMLEPDDVARAILFAIDQPARLAVNELVVRPSGQRI